eukprot:7306197-Alexandrium_andersonii.AAC.1
MRAKSGRPPHATMRRAILEAHSQDRQRARPERAIAKCSTAPKDSRGSFSGPPPSVPRAGDRHTQQC